MTDRLKRCIEAGSVVALFPLLRDWPEAELRALIRDARHHYDRGSAEILKAWNRAVFLPEVFFSQSKSKALDEIRREMDSDCFIVCTEICSVATYYLRGIRRGRQIERRLKGNK